MIVFTFKTTTGEIFEGPRVNMIRSCGGMYVLTARATQGFLEAQGVRICDAHDAGFRGIEVAVEGEDADGQIIRRTLSINDLALPFLRSKCSRHQDHLRD